MRFLLLFTLLPLLASSQIFHFEDSTTTLIKNVNQSPAHWYIEIYNDINIDTALRWKAEFENVPSEWEINFDTQGTYHAPVLHNDSADFRLPITNTYPQKLIIGAALNGKNATATVHFHIYDPFYPTYSKKISFHFIVSEDASLLEGEKNSYYTVFHDKIQIHEAPENAEFRLLTIDGKLISKGRMNQGNTIELPLGVNFFILQINSSEGRFSRTHKLEHK